MAIDASGADYLVPCDDLACYLLHILIEDDSSYKSLVERSIGAASSYGVLRSRFSVLNAAKKLGIRIPETISVGSLEDVQIWSRSKNGAIVLKRDGTWGGKGVDIVADDAALPEIYARHTTRPDLLTKLWHQFNYGSPYSFLESRKNWDREVIAQEFMNGIPANAMFACQNGRILGDVQVRVVASLGRTGPARIIELYRDERIVRAGRLLADLFQISGFFGLDFILDEKTREPYLIEMNPRCTRLGHIQVANQSDLCGILWAEWTGQAQPKPGNSALSNLIFYYPLALEKDAQGRLFGPSRFDVCDEDAHSLNELFKYRPALSTRLWRGLLTMLKHPRISNTMPALYFFNNFTD